MVAELRNRRKGKAKLVYGITEHPMMLATNKEIKSKDDVIRVVRIYHRTAILKILKNRQIGAL